MTNYVVGFMFSADGALVVLIQKRPTAGWQANLYNGVGGHVEDGEDLEQAMIREFLEETGVWYIGWEHYATLIGSKYTVNVYRAFSDLIAECKTMTDEKVAGFYTDDLSGVEVVPNLKFLIPLALHADGNLVLPVPFTFNDNLD